MVDSIFEAYRTMPEVVFPIPEIGDARDYSYGEMTLSIGKLGGGSIGKAYEGNWFVEVHYKGDLIHASQDLYNAMPYTHIEAAVAFADFTANGESAFEPFGYRLEDWAENYTYKADV